MAISGPRAMARWTLRGVIALLVVASLAALSGALVGAAFAIAWALALLLVERAFREQALSALADRLDDIATVPSTGAIEDRLDDAVGAIGARLAAVETRLVRRHRVTGLPTREVLLQAMTADGAGTLGIVAFADFDRMCAFDEALGERAICALIERLQRMVAPGRVVAHVDRAEIAIWFGPEIDPAAADNEIAAVTYALSDRIEDDMGAEILPEVRRASARLPADGATPQAVLTRALALLNPAAGVSAHALNPVTAARERYEIEQDLRQAIARGEFEMLYQPLVDADSGCVSGGEALLRWQHPVRGLVPPARFVPLVEAMGLADEIGRWTLNTACREARQWQTAGLGALTVAVNVSSHQLEQDDMRLTVERTLALHAIAPDQLEIELTESVAARDVGRAARLFDELRGLGVRIAIDDFGTGYSSLSALRRLSFDKIKIDREFVTHVDTRADSQAICQSIIALGRGLGIRVLAEGVERFEEYRWLRGHGCNHFQGYYFATPLDAAGFAAFARDRVALAHLLNLNPLAMQRKIGETLRA